MMGHAGGIGRGAATESWVSLRTTGTGYGTPRHAHLQCYCHTILSPLVLIHLHLFLKTSHKQRASYILKTCFARGDTTNTPSPEIISKQHIHQEYVYHHFLVHIPGKRAKNSNIVHIFLKISQDGDRTIQ